MLSVSSSIVTCLLFALFLLAGACALSAATLLVGRLIVAAGEAGGEAHLIIFGGALAGVLSAFVVYQISTVAPGVARQLMRRS